MGVYSALNSLRAVPEDDARMGVFIGEMLGGMVVGGAAALGALCWWDRKREAVLAVPGASVGRDPSDEARQPTGASTANDVKTPLLDPQGLPSPAPSL